MLRYILTYILVSFAIISIEAQNRRPIVVNAATRMPLSRASVFDRNGRPLGVTKSNGRLPYVSAAEYPLTIRYMGFDEIEVPNNDADTVFMQETMMILPEVVFESRQKMVLHMLAYVREYSTLSTYTDTVFLFREKMVDYMIPNDTKTKFKGWKTPRILTSRSFYRFTDSNGLDSVSNRCPHHFSWGDWLGILPEAPIPPKLHDVENGSDTIYGKYSPTEIWTKNGSHVSLDINIVADTISRKWVAQLSSFFRENVDFERFQSLYNYENVGGNELLPGDLAGYSFNIESNGRGRGMFRFNRVDESFSVSTYGEVYIVDKEYITLKEARKWENIKDGLNELAIIEPATAPELQPSIVRLIDRVTNVDHDLARLSIAPDRLMVATKIKVGVGRHILGLLKGAVGLDQVNAQRKWNNSWREFRSDRFNKPK